MPALTGGQTTALRQESHSSDMFLAILALATTGNFNMDVMNATVNDAGVARGDGDFVYFTPSGGSENNVKPGQIVFIGSSAGAQDVGVVRIKSIDTGTNELVIEENDLTITNGDFVTVKKLWLPRTKLPAIDNSGADVSFTKDGVGYTDENEAIPPLVVLGPPDAQFIDTSPGVATALFVDEYSWSLVGATPVVVTWTWDGGTLVDGLGTVASPYRVTFATPGIYWVDATATDDDATTKRGFRPVFIYNHPDVTTVDVPYTDFEAGPRSNTLQGTRQNFTVFGDATQVEFPDNAWVVRFNNDFYGGSLATVESRYPNRGHIKFVGFLLKDTLKYADDMSSVQFEALDITYILGMLPGFGQVLLDEPNPVNWTEMPDLDAIKAVHYLLNWHTTALEIVDLRYSLPMATSELLLREQRWGKASILQQCNIVLQQKGLFARLAATVQGCLEIRQDPNIMKTADRAGNVVTVVDFSSADFHSLEFQRRPRTQVQTVRGGGFSWDGTTATAMLAKSPGVPADAIVEVRRDGLIIGQSDGQGGLNRIVGDVQASLNNKDPRVVVRCIGNWDVFDAALQERSTIPLLAADNIRGVVYDDSTDWIVREATVNENAAGGYVESVEVVLEKETDGQDGLTVNVPEPGDSDWPEPPDPDPPVDPPLPGWETEDEGRRMIATSVGVHATDEIGDAVPLWYIVDNGFSDGNDRGAWGLARDPFHWWTSGGTESTLWAITNNGLWKMENFPSGTWTQIISIADMLTDIGRTFDGNYFRQAHIHMSAETEGRMAVIANYFDSDDAGIDHTGVWVIEDEAIENSEELVVAGGLNQVSGNFVRFAQHGAGLVLYAVTTNTPCHVNDHRNILWKTTTGGAPWSAIVTLAGPKGTSPSISVPYIDPTFNDQYVLWAVGTWCAGASGESAWKSEDSGTTFPVIPGTGFNIFKLGTGNHPDLIWLAGARPDDATHRCRWTSTGGSAWTTLPLTPAALNATASFVVWDGAALSTVLIGGNPTAGASGDVRLYYWESGDAAWADKTGNLEALGVANCFDIQRDSQGTA